MYSTPAKAWESVDVDGSRPYMWNGYEQRKGKHWLQGSTLARAKGVTALGRK